MEDERADVVSSSSSVSRRVETGKPSLIVITPSSTAGSDTSNVDSSRTSSMSRSTRSSTEHDEEVVEVEEGGRVEEGVALKGSRSTKSSELVEVVDSASESDQSSLRLRGEEDASMESCSSSSGMGEEGSKEWDMAMELKEESRKAPGQGESQSSPIGRGSRLASILVQVCSCRA